MRMITAYSSDAPKKPTNLTINSDLLARAKKLKINISSVLECALAEKVAQCERDAWIRENADSIAAYNEHVDTYGVFSDVTRTF